MSRKEFPKSVKIAAWARCEGRCEECGTKLWPGKFAYDHDLADGLGGKPTLENCRVLCSGSPGSCHSTKTGKSDVPRMAKADRQKAASLGAKTQRGRPMAGTKASGLRKRMDGTVERR